MSATPSQDADPAPGPQSKRERKRTKSGHTNANAADVPARCLLGSLPVELLDIILSSTTPRDILALARTSKFFCATLVNPAHAAIWKQARLQFVPPIPEPTRNFTESAYAAFLFDAGVCEACGKKTKAMYASFTIRLRLCEKDSCRNSWKTSGENGVFVERYDQDRYMPILQWIPNVETLNFGYPTLPFAANTQIHGLLLRKKDWIAAVDEFNKAALSPSTLQQYHDEKSAVVLRTQAMMQLAGDLTKWRNECIGIFQDVKVQNLSFSKIAALSEGWVLWDMIQSKSYGSLYRSKNVSWQLLERDDLEAIRSDLEGELIRMREARRGREDENAYRERRKTVKSLYSRLENAEELDAMPPLSVFRKLPMPQRIQYKIGHEPTSAVAKGLKSKLAEELVKEDISRWRNEAKAALGAVLGVKSWKTANTNQLHPADRLTARFRCKKCDDKDSARHWGAQSFHFAEACQHVCARKPGARSKGNWEADNFVPDRRAIDVVERVLQVCGCNPEDTKSIETVKKLGSRIICKTCPARLRMDFRTLMRHCSRHESTEIDILPEDQVEDAVPIEYGLRARLITKDSESERRQRIYRCRHCTEAPGQQATAPLNQNVPDAGGLVPNRGSVDEHVAETVVTAENVATRPAAARPARKGKPPKAYAFDGLRSHAKEKHGIEWIGDEDFYRELPSTPDAAVEST